MSKIRGPLLRSTPLTDFALYMLEPTEALGRYLTVVIDLGLRETGSRAARQAMRYIHVSRNFLIRLYVNRPMQTWRFDDGAGLETGLIAIIQTAKLSVMRAKA